MQRIGMAGLVLWAALGGAWLSGCKRIHPPVPLTELNAQQLRGHDVFDARCGQCHYSRRTGPLNGPSLKGIFQQDNLPSGTPANDERVTEAILRGRDMMPAVGRTMTPQEIDDVLAYLHTL